MPTQYALTEYSDQEVLISPIAVYPTMAEAEAERTRLEAEGIQLDIVEIDWPTPSAPE